MASLLPAGAAGKEKTVNASDAAEAAGELLRMRQSPAGALSITKAEAAASPSSQNSSPSSTGSTDVGTVVAKAKRAAASLWLLLHAQNCNLGGDRCPHSGCSDAKRILLHIKTCCSAQNCSECLVRGCQQSRKLLEHYKKCRDLRRRKQQQHVCLVCSLVARQARNVLEGKPARRSSAFKQTTSPENSSLVVPRLDNMPPPPPRAAAAPGKTADSPPLSESPPTTSQLMRPGLAALAAAAAPDDLPMGKPLGKSLDSSKTNNKISFLIHASEQRSSSSARRPRSESFDVSRSASAKHGIDDGYDPTVESTLTQELKPALVDEPSKARRRSASMSVLSYRPETIVEESSSGTPAEEQVFLMEEDEV